MKSKKTKKQKKQLERNKNMKKIALIALVAIGTLIPALSFAGATNGAGRQNETVNANDTDTYVITFNGGEPAMVVVSGDGDTDLDLYVYDENGNLVASDTDYTDDCIVSWSPRWTGKFVIRVRNRGNVYNRYTIATN